jgi:Acetyltransferase (GNAT) domain
MLSSRAQELLVETDLEYQALNDLTQMASFGQEWDLLLAQSRCNRAFNAFRWYCAVPLILPALFPLAFIARRAGVLKGVIPLWLDPGSKEVGFASDFCDHLDIIAADDDLEVIAGLLAFALQESPRYGTLLLKRVKPDSNCVRGARALGFLRQIEEGFATGTAREYAVINLEMGYETYLKSLSRKFRLNLNRMRHRAAAEGVIVRELLPGDLPPEHLPATFLSLHSARFGEASKLVAPRAIAWIHHLFPSLFAERRLRVFAALIGDQILGIDLAMVSSSGLYAWNGGFLPEVEEYDPGKLLIDKTIEQCCADGLMEYDIGWFRQQYKAHWRPKVRQIGNLQFDGREYQSMSTGC